MPGEEQKITNEVLGQKIDGLREIMEVKFDENQKDHDEVNNHLARLNGQVAENTKFRYTGKVYLAIAAFIISTIVALVVDKF